MLLGFVFLFIVMFVPGGIVPGVRGACSAACAEARKLNASRPRSRVIAVCEIFGGSAGDAGRLA